VRVARESIKLKDHMIPSGSTIMINIQGVHHNPDFWPQPLTYDPERFYQRDYSPYTFLPFVEGARSCLGQFLSLLESKVVLALLLQRFDFVSVDPAEAAKKHPYMVPIIPKTGHIMKVTRRM
jgi:beta-ring hydroxylase